MQQARVSDNATLNRRWRPALMAFFLRRVRNHAEAEDLTQEVFVRMLKSAEIGEAADSYVFQIAVNMLVDRARRSAVRERFQQAATADPARGIDPFDPHKIASGREELEVFKAALDALPERQRAMFILYRFENIGQEAIATTYGISASAVKQQIAKAMAALMSKMGGVG